MKPNEIYFTDEYEIHSFGKYVSVCWNLRWSVDEATRKGESFIGFFYTWFDGEDGWCSEPIYMGDEHFELDDSNVLLEELTNAIEYMKELL